MFADWHPNSQTSAHKQPRMLSTQACPSFSSGSSMYSFSRVRNPRETWQLLAPPQDAESQDHGWWLLITLLLLLLRCFTCDFQESGLASFAKNQAFLSPYFHPPIDLPVIDCPQVLEQLNCTCKHPHSLDAQCLNTRMPKSKPLKQDSTGMLRLGQAHHHHHHHDDHNVLQPQVYQTSRSDVCHSTLASHWADTGNHKEEQQGMLSNKPHRCCQLSFLVGLKLVRTLHCQSAWTRICIPNNEEPNKQRRAKGC